VLPLPEFLLPEELIRKDAAGNTLRPYAVVAETTQLKTNTLLRSERVVEWAVDRYKRVGTHGGRRTGFRVVGEAEEGGVRFWTEGREAEELERKEWEGKEAERRSNVEGWKAWGKGKEAIRVGETDEDADKDYRRVGQKRKRETALYEVQLPMKKRERYAAVQYERGESSTSAAR
jgi:hypothetical protein